MYLRIFEKALKKVYLQIITIWWWKRGKLLCTRFRLVYSDGQLNSQEFSAQNLWFSIFSNPNKMMIAQLYMGYREVSHARMSSAIFMV